MISPTISTMWVLLCDELFNARLIDLCIEFFAVKCEGDLGYYRKYWFNIQNTTEGGAFFNITSFFFFLSLESDNDVEKTNYSFCENLSPKAQAVVSKNRGIRRELLGFLSFLSRRRIMFQMWFIIISCFEHWVKLRDGVNWGFDGWIRRKCGFADE